MEGRVHILSKHSPRCVWGRGVLLLLSSYSSGSVGLGYTICGMGDTRRHLVLSVESRWGSGSAPSYPDPAGLHAELWFFPRPCRGRSRGGVVSGWTDCACDEHPLPPPTEPLRSVSSLEVHFDLLDLTELTDMSDQELAEVFADSDDESLAGESPAGLHPLPRAGCLRSPSWTRTRAEQNREKQLLGDPERQPAIVDTFLTMERPKED
uniref:Dysbindin domain-containing protein 1 n=1 Tax=Ursus maritimus TaxID=29073 RepID=A0A452TXX9_URSMA